MKQLVLAIMVILIAANVILTFQYKQDISIYETKFGNQSKLIKQYKNDNKNITENLHKTHIQLNQLKQENERLNTIINKKERVLNIKATAYISSCKGCSGTTFTEYPVNNTIEYSGLNIVATDTSIIPLYSIVRITTRNKSIYAIVLDKGGAIKGKSLDLLVSTYDKAIGFGRQEVTVSILREGKGELSGL